MNKKIRKTNYIIKIGDDFYAATDRLKDARQKAISLQSYNEINNIAGEILILKETKITEILNKYGNKETIVDNNF